MPFKSVFVAVVIATGLIVAAFLVNARRPKVEAGQPTPSLVAAAGKCAECHRHETPAIVDQFERSRHAVEGINCLDCQVFHLESAFFDEQTLGNLVYSAPFIAPLAYVGVGLLLLLVRMEPPESPAWGGVGDAPGARGLRRQLRHVPARPRAERPLPVDRVDPRRVGRAGGRLPRASPRVARGVVRPSHLRRAGAPGRGRPARLRAARQRGRRPAVGPVERFVFGAPAFAPLLFADLAVLAGIGLWAMGRPGVLRGSSGSSERAQ